MVSRINMQYLRSAVGRGAGRVILFAAALSCWLMVAAAAAVAQQTIAEVNASATAAFPPELVNWRPHPANPLFTASGRGHWDVKIRERGWILRENGVYHLWFTGYDGTREGSKRLGYSSSRDGIRWQRWPANPIYDDHWVEDMMVVKRGGTYYMFAEGAQQNHAVMLTSADRVNWQWQGPLDVRLADGKQGAPRPCGTPTVWVEHGTWYLFYEWLDRGVWLARLRTRDRGCGSTCGTSRCSCPARPNMTSSSSR